MPDQWEEEAQAVIANLRAERDEARAFGEKSAKQYNDLLADSQVVTCAFCGQEYPRGTPRHGDGGLAAHIEVCPKHPLAEAQERIKTLVIYGDSASELLGREAGKVIALRVEVARLEKGLRYIYVRNYTGAASVAQDVLGGKDLPDDEYRVAAQWDS